MPRVREILSAIEAIAAARFAFSSDRVGHQVGDPEQAVSRAVVAMDPSLAATAFAKSREAQLLLCHHPLIFNPVTSLTAQSHQGRVLLALAKAEVSFIAAHTNWDSAMGGINDTLCALLDVHDLMPIGTGAEVRRLKLVTFCPEADVQRVIDGATEAGAGVIGAYTRCAFTTPGTGTFLPGEGAAPMVGKVGRVERVGEVRVEMVLLEGRRRAVERAVRRAHSYHEAALDFFELAPEVEQPAGRLGRVGESTHLEAFSRHVAKTLGLATWTWGHPDQGIRRVAVVGGAADGEWMAAQRAGADVLVTGEVKQHVALEASESGFALIAAGHYATENPGTMALRDRMAEAVPDVEWLRFEPEPGASGRPW